MIEKDVRSGVCHDIHRYAKTNNKYQRLNTKYIKQQRL